VEADVVEAPEDLATTPDGVRVQVVRTDRDANLELHRRLGEAVGAAVS
jgi:hypothetical protein